MWGEHAGELGEGERSGEGGKGREAPENMRQERARSRLFPRRGETLRAV